MTTKRISSERITHLEPGQVFVFGSNKQGVHGKGAAKQATKWGAETGKGSGFYGQTYAIPTREYHGFNKFTTMTLRDIASYVDSFVALAASKPKFKFLVTEIGCGNAGYSPEQIAPLFKEASELENVYLPQRFWDELEKEAV